MSESTGQPKMLLRRPKKSQRVPVAAATTATGVSQSGTSAAASFSKTTGDGARNVSTVSGSSAGQKQPLWYRFRTALTTVLVVNAVLLGYVLFRTSSKVPENSKEDQKNASDDQDENKGKEKDIALRDTVKSETPEASKIAKSSLLGNLSSFEVNKPKISLEDQQQLYKWMLEERRKIKPSTKTEKAQIDSEKVLLKAFLKGKSYIDV